MNNYDKLSNLAIDEIDGLLKDATKNKAWFGIQDKLLSNEGDFNAAIGTTRDNFM